MMGASADSPADPVGGCCGRVRGSKAGAHTRRPLLLHSRVAATRAGGQSGTNGLRTSAPDAMLAHAGYRIHALTTEESVANADATMMKVQRILTGPMGLRISLSGSTIAVSFTDVSTRVNVSVTDWGTNKDGDPSSLVQLSCPLLWEVDPSPALFEWVARSSYYFGHITAYDD